MSSASTGRPSIPFGPTAKIVARNLLRLRKAQGLTTRAMSAALKEMGRPISKDALCKMENVARPEAKHFRRVDVDDLVALAVVLGVSPSALLLPMTDAPDDTVEVTGVGGVPADAAWDWMDGRRRLDQSCADLGAAALEYALYSRPPIRRTKEIGHG